MITEKDIRALRIHETRMGIIARWAIMIAPLFLFVMGVLNLWLASRIAGNEGFEFLQILQNWFDGFTPGAQYSDKYLSAMERISNALLQFGCAFPLLILAYSNEKRRNMDARIIATLKDAEVIKGKD